MNVNTYERIRSILLRSAGSNENAPETVTISIPVVVIVADDQITTCGQCPMMPDAAVEELRPKKTSAKG